MESKAITYIGLVLDYVNSIPADSWAALGLLVTSIGGTIGVVAWRKWVYFKKYAEKMASALIIWNVTFFSFIFAVASFVVLYGTQFGAFLPFLDNWPKILAGAVVVRELSQKLKAWWIARREGKSLLAEVGDQASIQEPTQPVIPVPAKPTPISDIQISQNPWG